LPSDQDLLFGKLAVTHGYCAQESVDRCIAIQATSRDRLPLGQILIREGYLSDEHHSQILALQRKNMTAPDPVHKKKREAILFGKLAVREGMISPDQVNKCLNEQAVEGDQRSLGEIMVEKGFLTPDQVNHLLAKQQKRIMFCPSCALSFTVLSISQGKKVVSCPRCKGPLQDGRLSDSTATDAELSTNVFRGAKHQASSSPNDSRVIPPGSKEVHARCVVCELQFHGFPDSTGRLRCPSCQSTFLPR
jgi:hypothetical protein